MRTVLTASIVLVLAAPAMASGGHITAPTIDASFVNGAAGYTVTNSVCAAPCSWRAVALALPALYPCPDEPFTAPGNIAWLSDDLTLPGTVAAPMAPFVGPGSPTRLCLYLDRRDRGADHYLLAAAANFTPNSLPGPAETFDAIIADPVATVVPRRRHARWGWQRWWR